MKLSGTVLLLVALASASVAEGPIPVVPEVRAVRATSPITIDGLLSEAAWQSAPAISGLRQQRPNDAGSYRLVVAGMSDVGCVRSNNEDSFGVFEAETPCKGCLMVLADGMGGAAVGEVASRLAVDTVVAHYLADRKCHRAQESMRTAIQKANRSVHERSTSGSGTGGISTTCTAAGISDNSLVVGHVGDSRAYLVRPESIEQLTADQTLAAELSEIGKSGAAVPESARHVLTRCPGSQPDVQVDVTGRVVRLDDRDAVVPCSNGLPAVVEDDEICQIVGSKPPREACRGLVELARSRGGPDNVTVLVGLLKAA